MKLGNKALYLFILILFFNTELSAENKIMTTPLVNLKELKPSFEETDDSIKDLSNSGKLKDRKKIILQNKSSSAKFIGLDKITAKTSDILINLGETKKFGPLEIKVLECGKIRSKNKKDNSVAYLQVKDISENENEKVFIFNGWTFASDPTIAPFDHAIYDLQLVGCDNV